RWRAGLGLRWLSGSSGRYDLPTTRHRAHASTQRADPQVSSIAPEDFATALADADRGIAAGELFVEGSDLEKLIGHAPTSLVEAVRVAHGA
ncbi:MAG: hypothetical protein ACT4QF_19235, partial [Sporichthyaceae bacterium]